MANINAYQEKAMKCIEQINNGILYIHIKGPDEFGHDGDANGKKMSIEQIDELFFKYFTKKCRRN